MEAITITEMGIYETLHASLKRAAETEQALRESNNDHHFSHNESTKRLDALIANELPAYMGKLISGLGLQPQFQSLGRYVRSFTDAEFVIRNLREQILSRIDESEQGHAGIKGLIECCDLVTGDSDTAAKAYG